MQSNPANTAAVVWQKSCLTFAARQCNVIWHHTDKFAELQNPVPWILNHLWLNTQWFPFTMIYFWMNRDEVNENPDFTELHQSTTDMLKQGWSQMTGSFCQLLLIYCFKHQNPYNALLCFKCHLCVCCRYFAASRWNSPQAASASTQRSTRDAVLQHGNVCINK